MNALFSFCSNHAKVVPALLGALFFVGIAFLPTLFGQYGKPTLDEKGKIKVEKAKDDSGKMKKGADEQKSMDHDKEERAKSLEIRSLHVTADGRLFVGGKHSLQILRDGKLETVEGFPGEGVKAVASTTEGVILVASKAGLHQYDGRTWLKLHESEGEAVAVAGEGIIFFAPKKMGLLQSLDGGKTWLEVALPTPPMTAKR